MKKINLIGDLKTVMHAPFGKHNYFAWPTVARLKNGKIAVGASGFRLAHICPFGKCVIAYSDENGESFTPPATVIDTPLDDRDAGLCPFSDSGLIVTSFNNTIGFQRKINETCRENDLPQKAYVNAYLDTVTSQEEGAYLGNTFRISYDNGVTFGPLYKSPITSPHGPIELSDGRILWVGTENNNISAYTINPKDGSMEHAGTVNTDVIKSLGRIPGEPYTIELDDGTLLCHIRADKSGGDGSFTIYQTTSSDGGRVWSEPYQLLGDWGGAPAHILKHSSGVLISSYGYRASPFEIRAMFSNDGGQNWDKDHVLYSNEISWDLGYPSTVELYDGSLLTVFYAKDKKDGPAKIFAQRWNFE